MRVNTSKSIGPLLLAAACGQGPTTEHATPSKAVPEAPAARQPANSPTSPTAPSTPAAPASPAGETLAQVRDDTPLPLTKLLGHTVDEVQAQLGAHDGKGRLRESCVRFLPERTWFRCRHAVQRYLDKTDNFAGIEMTYEDGVATGIAFDGYKRGGGTFTPEALLTAIGLTLPEPGKLQNPAPQVRLWSWFNSAARLKINDRQYRVELSVVGEDWARSKVEVIQNDKLTPEQQAQVVRTSATAEKPAESPAAP